MLSSQKLVYPKSSQVCGVGSGITIPPTFNGTVAPVSFEIDKTDVACTVFIVFLSIRGAGVRTRLSAVSISGAGSLNIPLGGTIAFGTGFTGFAFSSTIGPILLTTIFSLVVRPVAAVVRPAFSTLGCAQSA